MTVTAEDAARGEMTLAEVPTEVAPVPGVGDTPKLAFQHSDGSSGALQNYRGKYTVVHFWASWCEACKKQLPALRQLQERYIARGLVTLGLSLDQDTAAWQTVLKHLNLPWPQGRLAVSSDAGVSSVPAYWVLDPTGKIVAKTYDVEELAKALAERMK